MSKGNVVNWVHHNPFYQNRAEYWFENHILPMIINNELCPAHHVSFRSYFRLDYDSFQTICRVLESSLNNNLKSFRSDTISVREKVAVTLRYLASGDSYRTLELRFLISSKTIQKIVLEVCAAIISILGPII